ncbi:hypothetical protein Acr_00g0020400 [Actinidia rufa]|uniref:BED-type domain-containing protein n=1 Tax=Actinidia rufa TaxID=165716 RepID=A0A7J0DBZ2_9ERIC|nr:hypothetical protein Acr_00g0020400 [Actinidia rufa]
MSSSTGASRAPSSGEKGGSVLWRFVTKMEKFDGKGGNLKWKCNFCHVIKSGSYTRVRAHLLKIEGEGIGPCNGVTSVNSAEFHRLVEEERLTTEQNKRKKVPLPPPSPTKNKCRREDSSQSNPIIKAFNVGARDQLHSEIARMFYSGGLPFNLARNPYYVSSYTCAANNSIPGYIPPGYNLLRTKLLQRERANIERLLEPIKGTWREKGSTIASDGWSDSQRRPLINFMAVSGALPMFLKAVDCSGETKDKHFIASLMKEVVIEVGPKNVVQIITDNAPNCKAAGQISETQYPNIFWTPCVVHTLNLALKNICAAKNTENNYLVYDECSWRTTVIVAFGAETRFASSIVILRRFMLIKQHLQSMVISSSQWNAHREEVGASFVRETLLDEKWPTLHLIYDMWDSMIHKVKCAIYKYEGKSLDDEIEFYNVVHKILVDRWNKNNTPLHCLAHALNPRYYSDKWLEEDPNRVPLHRDEEVTNERKKCLKRYLIDSMERTKANVEYAKFSTKEGPFSDVDSIEDRWNMDPHSWWVIHGASASTLQTIALKILTQPSSSSCCERNWSTYSFIHSLKRNKMTPQRAEDLVFVHSNLHLLYQGEVHNIVAERLRCGILRETNLAHLKMLVCLRLQTSLLMNPSWRL